MPRQVSTRLRILYLADIRFPLERANGIQTMETCHAMAARGHQVRLLVRSDVQRVSRDPFQFYGLTRLPALQVRQLSVWGPAALRRLRYVLQAVRQAAARRQFDIVLTRDLGVASALIRFIPRARRPAIVYESHGVAPVVARAMPALLSGGRSVSRLKSRRLLARERRVWRRVDGYVTITAALARELETRFGKRDRLAVIPDGVRLVAERSFTALRFHNPPVAAYAGHLYPWKGVDVFVRSLALIPGARGLIVGGHPGEPDLLRIRALAATLGLEDRLTITGLVEPWRVASLLADADVLILPNVSTPMSSYTSPLKLFEYMAAGKPIVASELPSVREVLAPEEEVVLVEPDSPQALAQGISRVLANCDLAERLARHAFDRAIEYGWDRRAARLEALMMSVLKAS